MGSVPGGKALQDQTASSQQKGFFPKIRVPYVGILIIRILLFRVPDLDPPMLFFRKPPNQQAQTNDGTLYARNPLC